MHPRVLALPCVSLLQTPTGDELMLVFPVSKLLDVLKFPDATPSSTPQQHAAEALPHVRLVRESDDETGPPGHPQDSPGLTRIHIEVVAPQPCWGTLKLVGEGGRSITGWSIKEGEWREAGSFLAKQHSGSGSAMVGSSAHSSGSVQSSSDAVSSLIVKFTNEHQQAPLHWPITLALQHAGGSGSSQQEQEPGVGLRVELHVGYITDTPELAAVEQRMPAWSTLSYHATVFVGHWRF